MDVNRMRTSDSDPEEKTTTLDDNNGYQYVVP
jgi:hypothetical protein